MKESKPGEASCPGVSFPLFFSHGFALRLGPSHGLAPAAQALVERNHGKEPKMAKVREESPCRERATERHPLIVSV